MSKSEVLLKEHCGASYSISYRKHASTNNIVPLSSINTISESVFHKIKRFIYDVLLPHGFPNSVTEDYISYQLWDTLQAFCSTIIGNFTTKAIFKGVGVGDAEASALSATVTWILKDGTGMLGRIMFTWSKGSSLDCYNKQWRLFADILNDLALLTELCIPYVSYISLHMLCLSTTMKSIVGVAGGATRASITQHQALKGNMAEISAKDGSQETLVNLIASLCSIYLLNVVHQSLEWPLILMLMALHLYSNYKAVGALVYKNFNEIRLCLLLENYVSNNVILSQEKVNKKEAVFWNNFNKVKRMCGFKIIIGESLKNVISLYQPEELESILENYKNKNYIIVPDIDRRKIYVALRQNETAEDIIAAYFEAVLLGITICFYNDIPLDVYTKRHLHHSTPITRLMTFTNAFHKNTEEPSYIPFNLVSAFNEYVIREVDMFFTALQIRKWDVSTHAIDVGYWRAEPLENKKDL